MGSPLELPAKEYLLVGSNETNCVMLGPLKSVHSGHYK
jgi:hypothetical protein